MTRLRFWLGFLILMIFLCGFSVGKFVNDLVDRATGAPRRDDYVSRLVEALALNPSQEKRLVEILNQHAAEERRQWKTLLREHEELRSNLTRLRAQTEERILSDVLRGDRAARHRWRQLTASERPKGE